MRPSRTPRTRAGQLAGPSRCRASLQLWLKTARPDIVARLLPPGPLPQLPILGDANLSPARRLWLGADFLGPACGSGAGSSSVDGVSEPAQPASPARLAATPPSPGAGGVQRAHGTRRRSWCRTASQENALPGVMPRTFENYRGNSIDHSLKRKSQSEND